MLGPLAPLAGTWVGSKGWNIIAVPSAGSEPGDTGHFTLIVQQYVETLTFTPVGAPVRNRGGAVDQFVGALEYEQRINDATTMEVLHVENGLWLNLANIVPDAGDGLQADPPPEFSIGRSGSIPHGDAVLALGNATTTPGGPVIPAISTLPPDAGPSAPLGYTDPYLNGSPNVTNPNLALQQAIVGQTITNTTTITVDTQNEGGIYNIPFIVGHADATRMQCTFWIETVQLSPTQTIQQLQYSQIIDLEFHQKFGEAGLITWPHANTNTLLKQ
ncbi:MAG: hypothetical protein JST22_12650 [Bacteroidetes bacterium]|nr:hypothetical protein [Bacteroidota bacterium]